MTYLVWFDFVGIITLNGLIFPLHKVQKSSCINMSFDWICLAFRGNKSSVSRASSTGKEISLFI